MTPPSPADAALARLNTICLAFPGADCKLSHGAPSFHVRGKMFLMFVDHHHNDGRLAVWCKATLDEQRRLVADDAVRFFVPPYVGVKGWVGVRLDLPQTDWIELAILVESAWASIAPKGIASATTPLKRAAPFVRPTTDAKLAAESLRRLTAICLALPEATCERAASHAGFKVRKKTFAYFLDNHGGDEIIAASVRVPKGQNAKLVKSDPARFYLPAYLAAKGWVGVRLDGKRVDWKSVTTLVTESWRSVAPKTLVRALRARVEPRRRSPPR